MATSTFPTILERTQTVLKVRPNFWGELREEMEQWVGNAVEVQAELWKVLRVEAVVDPEFEQPPEADELVKEIKEVKVWLESSAFTLHPVFVEADTSLAPCPVSSQHLSKEPKATQSTGKDPEEYQVKEEKGTWEAEVREPGTKVKAKGKVKDKGSLAGSSSISSRGILDTVKGT
ncbi:hypothetical protein JB92DRAFT_3117428 [Gautieria morchelliformis]|nr:hypothetical protein JB92DRAFT_3117428 [Gautieria morchelliformis]